MNKKSIKIIATVFVIIIVAIILFLTIYDKKNNGNYTKSQYKVEIVSNMVEYTEYPMIGNITKYYEIDIDNKTVKLKEDFSPTDYYKEIEDKSNIEFYTGKVINTKELNDKECSQLKELLDKVIENGNSDYEIEPFITYYIVSNKYKSNILMDNEEDISLFLKIMNF